MPTAASTASRSTSTRRQARPRSEVAMKTRAFVVVAFVLAVRVLTIEGQTPAPSSGIRFHHVHLNSVNPEAAADYYTKVFTSSVRTTFNGEVAVKTVNGPYVLFTKVNRPPPTQPQSAI